MSFVSTSVTILTTSAGAGRYGFWEGRGLWPEVAEFTALCIKSVCLQHPPSLGIHYAAGARSMGDFDAVLHDVAQQRAWLRISDL